MYNDWSCFEYRTFLAVHLNLFPFDLGTLRTCGGLGGEMREVSGFNSPDLPVYRYFLFKKKLLDHIFGCVFKEKTFLQRPPFPFLLPQLQKDTAVLRQPIWFQLCWELNGGKLQKSASEYARLPKRSLPSDMIKAVHFLEWKPRATKLL